MTLPMFDGQRPIYVVTVEPGLSNVEINAIVTAIRAIPAVHAVIDLRAITQETLDLIVLRPIPAPVKARKIRSPTKPRVADQPSLPLG